jgi:hypothetical protein
MTGHGNGSEWLQNERRLSTLEAVQNELIRRIANIEKRQDDNSDADHQRDNLQQWHVSKLEFLTSTIERIEEAYLRLETDQRRILVSLVIGLAGLVMTFFKSKLGL